MQVIFWLSAAALSYTYAGYALLLLVVSKLRPRAIRSGKYSPSVSLIITAYNEERDLAVKLENALALDYPRELLEIIVASDCSTDATDEIARSFAERGVNLMRQPVRLGKTAAQNAAVQQAHGEIILFSDATSHYQPDVVRKLMPSFADETVGCVSGRLIYVDPSTSRVGDGARSYWNYETFLKKHESRAYSLIGASGCLYAVRRTAYVPLANDACSDFIIATKMAEQGLRCIYEPQAVCTEATNRRSDNELRMRVRVITQTLNDLWRHRSMLNPIRAGFYSVQLLSHKVMRYMAPFFLIVLFVTSAILAVTSLLFRIALIGQFCVYGVTVLSWIFERAGMRNRFLALPQYFMLANLASLMAFYKFLSGERYARWQPIREDSQQSLTRPTENPVS